MYWNIAATTVIRDQVKMCDMIIFMVLHRRFGYYILIR